MAVRLDPFKNIVGVGWGEAEPAEIGFAFEISVVDRPIELNISPSVSVAPIILGEDNPAIGVAFIAYDLGAMVAANPNTPEIFFTFTITAEDDFIAHWVAFLVGEGVGDPLGDEWFGSAVVSIVYDVLSKTITLI